MTPSRVRRPMTADEITMGTALGFVRCLPATFDKRFIGEMAACARDDEPAITDAQASCLRRMVHTYRRQLRAEILALAGTCHFDGPDVVFTSAAAIAPVRASIDTPQLSLL